MDVPVAPHGLWSQKEREARMTRVIFETPKVRQSRWLWQKKGRGYPKNSSRSILVYLHNLIMTMPFWVLFDYILKRWSLNSVNLQESTADLTLFLNGWNKGNCLKPIDPRAEGWNLNNLSINKSQSKTWPFDELHWIRNATQRVVNLPKDSILPLAGPITVPWCASKTSRYDFSMKLKQ